MKKRVLGKKLVLHRETLTALQMREVAGASVRLSCDGQRCSNDSACYATDTNPLCAPDSAPNC